MTEHPANEQATAAAAGHAAADPQAAAAVGQQQAGATAIVGVDPAAAAQAGFYTQAGYYPTTASYATAGQPFGSAAQQMMSSYQYVMPQAATGYSQPTYGWAYYPSANGQQDVAAQAMPGVAVIPGKDGSGGTQLSEREQKALRRKQANRESARRSKIRKKAESETLGKKAENLDEESHTLQTEMEIYTSELERLKSENSSLRVKASQRGVNVEDLPPINVEEFQLPDMHELGRPTASVDQSPASTGPTSGQHAVGDAHTCGTSALKGDESADAAVGGLGPTAQC